MEYRTDPRDSPQRFKDTLDLSDSTRTARLTPLGGPKIFAINKADAEVYTDRVKATQTSLQNQSKRFNDSQDNAGAILENIS